MFYDVSNERARTFDYGIKKGNKPRLKVDDKV